VDETGAACATSGGDESPYRVLVGTPEGKRPPGRPTHRCQSVDWIYLDNTRDKLGALVNTVMNLRVPINAEVT